MLQNSVTAETRDIDYLKARFFADYRCDTNDILTLFSYWQSNFQHIGSNPNGIVTPSGNAGGQITQGQHKIGGTSGQEPITPGTALSNAQHNTLSAISASGGMPHAVLSLANKSNNVTAFAHRSRLQQQ